LIGKLKGLGFFAREYYSFYQDYGVVLFELKNLRGLVRLLFQQALPLFLHCYTLLLLMAHLLYEPCSHLSRAFFHYPSISSSEANRRLRFTFRACSDANAGENSDRVFVKEKKKLYGFACLPHPPLLGDFEKGISVEDRSLGGSPSKPFCFDDQHLLKKLVVAVDVDEGVSLCMCSPSFLCYMLSY